MSRFARYLGASLVVASLVGCAGEERIGELEVRVLYPPGGVGDGSLADAIFSGVVAARSGTDFRVVESSPESVADARATFEEWVATGGERVLIVLGTAGYTDFVLNRGCDFGASSVLLLDSEAPTCANLRSVRFDAYAPAYLAGVAAVSDPSLSPDQTAGIVAGADVPNIRELIRAFTAGVESAGGSVARIEFVSTLPEVGFADPARASELTASMLAEVNVVYAAAGRSGEGVATRLEEHLGSSPASVVYFIGSDTDQATRHGDITVGSVLKRLDFAVRDAILEMIGGRLSTGAVRVGFRDRWTEFLTHPRRGTAVLDGDCSGCSPFEPRCYRGCRTLDNVLEDARERAGQAAESEDR
ncbi:MAG: BMP family ABC transporter substrate-binding protein [Myxococcota bacterium]